MYNRFRYGNTFVNGSSVAQQVQDPSAPIDPNFDPMYNRFRYGNTFVKGSSVAQTEPLIPVNVLDPTLGGPGSRGAHAQVAQVQDPSAPIDPNFDPMYNRFRYGNTFVKGSSVAQVTPDHPVYSGEQTAGAPADGTLPRFGAKYLSR